MATKLSTEQGKVEKRRNNFHSNHAMLLSFFSIQNVLKFTEQEHPDYYLLLVCVQRLRVFISHYTLLFQCNEDLLIQKRKKLKK